MSYPPVGNGKCPPILPPSLIFLTLCDHLETSDAILFVIMGKEMVFIFSIHVFIFLVIQILGCKHWGSISLLGLFKSGHGEKH